jgi:hypothetical protein
MREPLCGALLLALCAWSGASPAPAAAEPVGTALARCAAIAGAEARLACYDTLAAGRAANLDASPAAPTAAAPAAAAPVPAAPAAAAPAAPPAAAPVAPPVAAAAAPAPAPTAAADPVQAAQNFGLSSAQRHDAPAGPSSIEARVSQMTVDRALRSFVVLDNGQTWASTDGGLQLNTGERVTIKRAALGSFMLVSTTSKHSYHVRRVR